MKLLLEILICFLAGAGAGIGTGFAGMSAAAVIGPMLASFLGVPAYEAVGIGLVSDVLASAVSAYTYKKSDVKNSLPMMISVLIVTVIGSFVASFLPERAMGSTMQIALIILGLRFILKPVTTTKEQMNAGSAKERLMKAIIGGIVVGFICGFVGAGGGMMMLLILTSVLGYELKTAVGTSVFIMTFTALTGAISHFTIGGTPDILTWVLCIVFTLIWARIAAVFANKAKPKTLNRATGIILVVLGVVIMGFQFLH